MKISTSTRQIARDGVSVCTMCSLAGPIPEGRSKSAKNIFNFCIFLIFEKARKTEKNEENPRKSRVFCLISFKRLIQEGAARTAGKPPIARSDSALWVPTKKHPNGVLFCWKAPPGIGPGNKGFADLCLTAWLWRRLIQRRLLYHILCRVSSAFR